MLLRKLKDLKELAIIMIVCGLFIVVICKVLGGYYRNKALDYKSIELVLKSHKYQISRNFKQFPGYRFGKQVDKAFKFGEMHILRQL